MDFFTVIIQTVRCIPIIFTNVTLLYHAEPKTYRIDILRYMIHALIACDYYICECLLLF